MLITLENGYIIDTDFVSDITPTDPKTGHRFAYVGTELFEVSDEDVQRIIRTKNKFEKSVIAACEKYLKARVQ